MAVDDATGTAAHGHSILPRHPGLPVLLETGPPVNSPGPVQGDRYCLQAKKAQYEFALMQELLDLRPAKGRMVSTHIDRLDELRGWRY